MLPELENYLDLFKKLEVDVARYQKDNHIYTLLDCFLTLNAMPEWIEGSSIADQALKDLAKEKIAIMKGANGFVLDESKLQTDIDHQLRLIRLLCNQTKHSSPKAELPVFKSKWGATLPFTLPARLGFIVAIGTNEYDAEPILINVMNFWKQNIGQI